MENNEPNKIINSIFKSYQKLNEVKFAVDYDYKKEQVLKQDLLKIFLVVGAVEVMSKNSLLKLIYLNGKLRAIPFHTFHFPVAKMFED